jgi:urea transport system ATP-binding protein
MTSSRAAAGKSARSIRGVHLRLDEPIDPPRGRGVWGSLFFRRSSDVIARVHDVARDVYLDDQLHTPAELLSHAQKQWLEIGMLLIADPQAGFGLRAEGAVAGRADRGHLALDHQGHRQAAERDQAAARSDDCRVRAGPELHARDADRVLVMDRGRLVHEDARATVDEAKISRYLSV